MSVFTFMVTVAYVYLLKYFTKPLLYVSMILIFLLGCGTGYFAWSKTSTMEDKESYEYRAAQGGSVFIFLIVALYTCFICCNWNFISLAASIMETTSEFVVENQSVVYLPMVTYACCLPIIIWWTFSAVFIYSMGTPVFEKDSFIAEIEGVEYSG